MANLPTNRTTANTPAEHVADHNTLHADHNLLEGGSNGQVLTKVAGAAAWAAPSGSSVAFKRTKYQPGADITTTSTSFVDIDATNIPSLTLTLAIGDVVELVLTAPWGHSAAGTVIGIDWLIDQPVSADTNVRGSVYAAACIELGTNSLDVNTKAIYATFTATEAGVHGFKPQWKTGAGTARIEAGGNYSSPVMHTVKNLGQPTA